MNTSASVSSLSAFLDSIRPLKKEDLHVVFRTFERDSQFQYLCLVIQELSSQLNQPSLSGDSGEDNNANDVSYDHGGMVENSERLSNGEENYQQGDHQRGANSDKCRSISGATDINEDEDVAIPDTARKTHTNTTVDLHAHDYVNDEGQRGAPSLSTRDESIDVQTSHFCGQISNSTEKALTKRRGKGVAAQQSLRKIILDGIEGSLKNVRNYFRYPLDKALKPSCTSKSQLVRDLQDEDSVNSKAGRARRYLSRRRLTLKYLHFQYAEGQNLKLRTLLNLSAAKQAKGKTKPFLDAFPKEDRTIVNKGIQLGQKELVLDFAKGQKFNGISLQIALTSDNVRKLYYCNMESLLDAAANNPTIMSTCKEARKWMTPADEYYETTLPLEERFTENNPSWIIRLSMSSSDMTTLENAEGGLEHENFPRQLQCNPKKRKRLCADATSKMFATQQDADVSSVSSDTSELSDVSTDFSDTGYTTATSNTSEAAVTMSNNNVCDGETPTVSEHVFEHYAHDIVPRASRNENCRAGQSSTASIPRQDNNSTPQLGDLCALSRGRYPEADDTDLDKDGGTVPLIPVTSESCPESYPWHTSASTPNIHHTFEMPESLTAPFGLQTTLHEGCEQDIWNEFDADGMLLDPQAEFALSEAFCAEQMLRDGVIDPRWLTNTAAQRLPQH